MRTLILTIFILLTINLFGQNQIHIQKVLDKKDFSKLKKYIKKKTRFNHSLIYYRNKSDMLHDLTTENQEGVYYFIQSCADSTDLKKKKDFIFRVKILTYKNEIIYYELSKDIRKKLNDRWSENYILLSEYKNDTAFRHLNVSFKLIYKVNLKEKELFNQDIIYGEACGRGGIDPQEKTKVDEFIANNDKESLIKWLQSTNSERQIYAISGLYYLNKKGTQLNSDELQMINFVKNKKGAIKVCFGCYGYTQTIQQATKQFTFK